MPSARCGGGERRAGGGGHQRATQAQGPPSTRHRIGCLACVPPPPSAGWQSPTRICRVTSEAALPERQQGGHPSFYDASPRSANIKDLGELMSHGDLELYDFDPSQITSSHVKSQLQFRPLPTANLIIAVIKLHARSLVARQPGYLARGAASSRSTCPLVLPVPGRKLDQHQAHILLVLPQPQPPT